MHLRRPENLMFQNRFHFVSVVLSVLCTTYVKMWSVRLYVDKHIIPVSASGWEDNIEKDLKEIWEDMEWILLAQYGDRWRAVVSTVRNFWDNNAETICIS